jgi:aspartate/methionine/tyrosine aminotransferase
VKIREFGVETWMNHHETQCRLNLAETCVESLTVAELLALCGRPNAVLDELLPMKLTYGAIEGSRRLRAAIAALYDRQSPENVLVTHGAIGANALVHRTLVEPGDRVVSVKPTYQQHYSIPESLGAEVAILPLRAENGFLPDPDELDRLADDRTRLIVLNNPNNPTGALMDRGRLEAIVAIAARRSAWLLCDEVYRGLDQEGDGVTASVADLYERGISTGSMSKAFSLAGLRLGWIAGPEDLLRSVTVHRDYDTISVGMIDDFLAALALENSGALLARSRAITRENLALLSDWVEGEPSISWVRPRSGTTALLRYAQDIPSEAFCTRLLERTGVLLVPGAVMDMEGHLRIGYANAPDILRAGLSELSGFLAALER